MKQSIDLRSGQEHRFNAGQAGQFLIIREASQSVILQGDNIRPLEIERGDTINVSRFDDLVFFNRNDTAVHIEYQIADVDVRIKQQLTHVAGALDIGTIHNPVVISRIQEPIGIDISGDVRVLNFPQTQQVSGQVSVGNFPQNQVVSGQVSVGNFPQTQQVDSKPTQVNGLPAIALGATGQAEIAANPNRKGLMVQAGKDNAEDILIAGFIRLSPDGVATIPASNSLTVRGIEGDTLTLGEVV